MSSVHLESIRYERRDKREGFIAFTMNPIMGDTDTKDVRGVLLLGRDITEKQLLEQQLLQAQKLESIGQLAAGVAHEINTPMQFLSDNTRFLDEAFGDLQKVLDVCSEQLRNALQENEGGQKIQAIMEEVDVTYLTEEIPKAISQSLEGIDRVVTIVRAMKEFSHPGVEGKTSIDINKAIESTVTVSRNEWKYVAELEMELAPQLPMVSCFAGSVNQVMLNLIVNAAQAIAEVVRDGANEKGSIRIRTREDGNCVEIRITDTGTGIPEHVRDKIFDPFFTTKTVGKGTGQGLSLVHTVIVEKHGGTLNVETEVGKGTTFIIRLPLANNAAAEEH